MWIRTQTNRLINLDKIECVEMVGRRETTEGTVVYELLARVDSTAGKNYILARLADEAQAQQLFLEIATGISKEQHFIDIIAIVQNPGG